MNTNPAVGGPILKGFVYVFAAAFGAVYAVDTIVSMANRQHHAATGGWGPTSVYNTMVQDKPERIDTIFDREKIMRDVKAKKPWNMTMAEKEMVKRNAKL